MKRVVLTTVLLVVLSVSGCLTKPASTPTLPTPTNPNVTVDPAPITGLQVIAAQSQPLQYSATFKVGLRDTCTTFHDLTTTRSGNTVTITVTIQHQNGTVCGQIYTFMDKTVNLGSSFTSGQTYTVNVNDQTTTFKVP